MSAEVLVSSVQFMRRRKSSFVLKISVTGNDSHERYVLNLGNIQE